VQHAKEKRAIAYLALPHISISPTQIYLNVAWKVALRVISLTLKTYAHVIRFFFGLQFRTPLSLNLQHVPLGARIATVP